MAEADRDTLLRVAAFEHVRTLSEIYDHLTANELRPGFIFDGERIPLVNPQRGIFKPRQMRFLLSIKTVFPKPGAKVWYDASSTTAKSKTTFLFFEISAASELNSSTRVINWRAFNSARTRSKMSHKTVR